MAVSQENTNGFRCVCPVIPYEYPEINFLAARLKNYFLLVKYDYEFIKFLTLSLVLNTFARFLIFAAY